ncbi:OLC1v1033218C1 [Oldenlandia corymbosa var. corymbosa]|uniref:OLC1v1033218C1 n=1 Tax=Oldenlandia corymbosa var. corymbosa TaxID=529605 RepID=A0AAV1CNH7_OLDCO|nr:OLC1v1033218C1 [Oldenlandia corymbosa var. corymbosa]
MATESNTGVNFHHHHHPHNHRPQTMSFQTASMGSDFVGNYYYGGQGGGGVNMNVNNAAGGIVFSGTPAGIISSSSSSNSGIPLQQGSSLGTLLLDTVPGLKHEAGLAVEWSVEEQYKLEEGLVKFADEPSIMKYIKIAAALRDKSVRDVALRCRWMMRKRRKQEDHNLGKKVKDRRDRIESCMKNNIGSPSSMSMGAIPAYSTPLQAQDPNHVAASGALPGTSRHLLEENKQALGQISSNLSALKLQENVDLFLRTRSNLTTILNDMRNMPGIMSQMPPLPVCLNEELANCVLPSSSQVSLHGFLVSFP